MDVTHPEAVKLVAVTLTLLGIITIFASVRLFVRSVLLRSIDWDDGLLFTSFAITVAFFSVVLSMTGHGFGSPVATVDQEDLEMFLKLQQVTQLCYVWGFVTVKMSFAALYIRLLPGNASKRISQVLLCVLAAEGLASTFVVVFQCNPIHKAWTPDAEGTCRDLKIFYYTAFAIKFITDVTLFSLPIPVVWKLQLSMAKRVGAIMMLSIGLFVCIIAIVRVTFIGQLSPDVTKDLVVPMIWSQVEVAALVICACIPSFRPFLRCFPGISKALGLSSTDKYSQSPYNVGRSPAGPSLPLGSRSNPRHSRMSRMKGGGHMVAATEATICGPPSDHGSQEEIFPQKNGENYSQQKQAHQQAFGGITVTRDVEIGVESADTDDSSRNTASLDKGEIVTSVDNGKNNNTRSRSPVRPEGEDMSWVKLDR